jgi:hypothetical protein
VRPPQVRQWIRIPAELEPIDGVLHFLQFFAKQLGHELSEEETIALVKRQDVHDLLGETVFAIADYYNNNNKEKHTVYEFFY